MKLQRNISTCLLALLWQLCLLDHGNIAFAFLWLILCSSKEWCLLYPGLLCNTVNILEKSNISLLFKFLSWELKLGLVSIYSIQTRRKFLSNHQELTSHKIQSLSAMRLDVLCGRLNCVHT